MKIDKNRCDYNEKTHGIMKLKYDKHKGDRIKYGFMGFSNYNWWWIEDLKKWVKLDDPIKQNYSYSSHRSCKSIRAFRRMLKTAPKGVEFTFVARWVGYDVYGKGNKCENN